MASTPEKATPCCLSVTPPHPATNNNVQGVVPVKDWTDPPEEPSGKKASAATLLRSVDPLPDSTAKVPAAKGWSLISVIRFWVLHVLDRSILPCLAAAIVIVSLSLWSHMPPISVGSFDAIHVFSCLLSLFC